MNSFQSRAREQVRLPEAGNPPHETLRERSRELYQLPREVVVHGHLLIRRARFQAAQNVLGKSHGHGSEHEERRQDGASVSTERFVYLGQRPPLQGKTGDPAPRKAPRAPGAELLFPVVPRLADQRSGRDPEHPRAISKSVPLRGTKEQGADALAMGHIGLPHSLTLFWVV